MFRSWLLLLVPIACCGVLWFAGGSATWGIAGGGIGLLLFLCGDSLRQASKPARKGDEQLTEDEKQIAWWHYFTRRMEDERDSVEAALAEPTLIDQMNEDRGHIETLFER